MTTTKYMHGQINAQNTLINLYVDMYSQARSFRLSSSDVIIRTNAIQQTPAWKRSLRPVREYVRGYAAALWSAHYNELIFAFIVNGKTLTIDSAKYKQYSAKAVHDHASWSGHVYRTKPSARWS